MAYGKRVVLLQGPPVFLEDGAAGATIRPGYLLQGVTTKLPHASAGGKTPVEIALEREELGVGIDATYASSMSGAGDYYYHSGDQVKSAVMYPGCRFTGWIASGQTITVDQQMESAGDGSFRALSAGAVRARALETISATALTLIRLEAM